MSRSLHIKIRLAVLALALFSISRANAQTLPNDTSAGVSVEGGVTYSWLHANAPPVQCGCFSSSGGSGNVALNLPHAFSFIGEVSGFNTSSISGTAQNVTLLNYLFGGRYTARTHTPLRLFGQALAGVSHESSNYTYVQSVSAFAASVGGGARLRVGRHLGLNLIQADWIHSTLPNGSNSRQNDLRLSTGFYFVLGSH